MSALDEVNWGEYDFVDFGCSKGGSIRHCMKRFGAKRGLGIDIDEGKVADTRAAGFDAVIADARELDLKRQVSFIAMLDFLEHLPNLDYVREVLDAAARSARDFIYIKHPSFEGQERLEAQGVRQYWWDWHGHTAHIRVADYCAMFDLLGLRNYMIRFVERIADSRHESIIPTSMPRDQSVHDAAAVSDTPFLAFDPPVWRRQDIFIALRPFKRREWEQITQPTARDLDLMRSSGQLVDDPSLGRALTAVNRKATLKESPSISS